MRRLTGFQAWQRSRRALAAGVRAKLVLVMACLVVGAGLFLPIFKGGFGQRVPRGQFRADLRTMAAVAHYVFSPEVKQTTVASVSNGDVVLAFNNGGTGNVSAAAVTSATITNVPLERMEAETNLPAQS